VSGDRYLLERAASEPDPQRDRGLEARSRVRLRVDRSDGQAMLARRGPKARGFPRIASPRFFDSFFLDQALWRAPGMGLPNVRRIVAAHGGAISVKSKPGEGTTFRPLVAGERPSPPRRRPRPATMP